MRAKATEIILIKLELARLRARMANFSIGYPSYIGANSMDVSAQILTAWKYIKDAQEALDTAEILQIEGDRHEVGDRV